jgi:hypothetical protein
MSDLHKNFLLDLGYLLREYAEKARDDYERAKATDDAAFECGYLMACHAVMSLLVDQAAAFELPLADIRLEGFDPDELL